MILQPGTGRINGEHYLPVNPDTSRWGWWPNGHTETVLSVDDGSVVTVDALSHEGIMEDQGRDPIGFFARHGVDHDRVLADAVDVARHCDHVYGVDGAHVVTGPIEVRGAEPGDLLRVDVVGLALRVPYGVTSNRHGLGALPGEMPDGSAAIDSIISDPRAADQDRVKHHIGHSDHSGHSGPTGPALTGAVDAGSGQGHPLPAGALPTVSMFTSVKDGAAVLRYGEQQELRYPIGPFLGMMGVTAAGSDPVPSRPPGPHGGNLDLKWLTRGSRLYLPVQVPGAGFAVGDPHFAQGNGEVALTALEGSLRADLRLSLLRGPQARRAAGLIENPFVETDDHWIPIGLDPDLDEALRDAVREALRFCQTRLGLPRHVAYAYLSAAADFEISQVVNEVKGVHCRIAKRDFPDHA